MSEKAKETSKLPESKRKNSISHIKNSGFSHSINSSVDRARFLQGTIGNQATQRMFKSNYIQTKLKIGQLGDKYEQEADKVANTVAGMPTIKNTGTEKGNINRESSTKSDTALGRSLSQSVRLNFESRFGCDFSSVRIHTGSKSEEIARVMNAKALTVGNNVIFGKDQFSPETVVGQKLLAHELTHVVQQTQPGGSHVPSIQMLTLPAKGGLAGAGLGALLGTGVGVLLGGLLGGILGGLAGLLVGGVLGFLGGKLLTQSRLRTILFDGLSEADKKSEEQALDQIANGQLTFTAATGIHAGVRAVQIMLLTLGYPTGREQVRNRAGRIIGVSGTFTLDNDYGPGTEAGMQLFQREWNDAHPNADTPLRVDGACDSSTLSALMTATTERVSGTSFGEFAAQKDILARTALMNTQEIDNNYGEYIRATASEYSIPDDVVAAIIIVETVGWIRHRLEYHWYQRFLNLRNNGGRPIRGITQNQLQNMSLSEIRILSSSWGLGQVMGFNLYNAGITFDEMQNVSDYSEQVNMIGRFLQANNLLAAARNRNWNAIAAIYNGPGRVGFYAPQLQAASNAWLNFMAQNL